MESSPSILTEDAEILASDAGLMAPFAHKTVLITGATGLIGAQVVRALITSNRANGSDITVLALMRNRDKAERVLADCLNDPHLKLVSANVADGIPVDGAVDYIVHAASPTSSQFFVNHPVDTIETAFFGTRNALRLAADKKVAGMVYLSSLEVYGTPSTTEPLKESDGGYLDQTSVRSSYSEGKRLCETLCASFAAQYQVPVSIARLSQTFGPGVEYHDGRVFAEFARNAYEGKDIVLHTQGRTLRTYCYTRDAVAAILTLLAKGQPGQAYNVSNPDTAVTIRQMAEIVAGLFPEKQVAVRIEVPDDLASYGYNPEMVIKLDSTKLQKLGWQPTTGLHEMFERMIAGFSERA